MKRGSNGSDQGRSRHRLFFVLLLVLVLGSIEIGSWILLRFVPEPVAAQAGSPEREHFGELSPKAQAKILLLQNRYVLHPFLGEVLDPVLGAGEDVPDTFSESWEYGFSRSKPRRIFYAPAEDRILVGVFGGSVAVMLGNVGEEVIVEELGRAARFAGKEILLVNFGQGAYKQPQQLMTLNYFLAIGAHLDVVVNVDGFNEVALAPADNLKQGVFPFYPNRWYYLGQEFDGDEHRAVGELTYLRARLEERAAAFADSPLRYVSTAKLLWRIRSRRLAQRMAAAEHAVDAAHAAAPASYQTRGPRRKYSSRAELTTDLADVWFRSSLQMHAMCTALGIEYYHFLQPNQYVPATKTLSSEELRTAFDKRHPYAAGAVYGYPLLLEKGAELRRLGVSFHDTTRVFAEIPDTLYTDPCCHFNWRGNLLLAREISRKIVAASTDSKTPFTGSFPDSSAIEAER